jgi:hypothetical protein
VASRLSQRVWCGPINRGYPTPRYLTLVRRVLGSGPGLFPTVQNGLIGGGEAAGQDVGVERVEEILSPFGQPPSGLLLAQLAVGDPLPDLDHILGEEPFGILGHLQQESFVGDCTTQSAARLQFVLVLGRLWVLRPEFGVL